MPYERKIINDPVFGFINIPKGLLYDIVRHPLLQRLTRIKQVGLSSVVYPGAQHTRFQHSLGAFYLMSEAITQLTSKGNFIFDSEAEAVQAAILLHDIGHGPFSHVLEDTIVQGVSHEEISLMLMERMNKEMNGQLSLAIQIFTNIRNGSCISLSVVNWIWTALIIFVVTVSIPVLQKGISVLPASSRCLMWPTTVS
jgi:HD superfamily phosphohydrolase